MRERGKWVMGIEAGTCWDEHWVLYGNQFDNKFHILKEKLMCVFGIISDMKKVLGMFALVYFIV